MCSRFQLLELQLAHLADAPKWLTSVNTEDTSMTSPTAVTHARRQPAFQEQWGLSVLLRDTSNWGLATFRSQDNCSTSWAKPTHPDLFIVIVWIYSRLNCCWLVSIIVGTIQAQLQSEVHPGRPHESCLLRQVQPQRRVACKLLWVQFPPLASLIVCHAVCVSLLLSVYHYNLYWSTSGLWLQLQIN